MSIFLDIVKAYIALGIGVGLLRVAFTAKDAIKERNLDLTDLMVTFLTSFLWGPVMVSVAIMAIEDVINDR